MNIDLETKWNWSSKLAAALGRRPAAATVILTVLQQLRQNLRLEDLYFHVLYFIIYHFASDINIAIVTVSHNRIYIL